MSVAAAEALLARAQGGGDKWPLARERPILTAINTWVALRERNDDVIKRIAGNNEPGRYRVDPLPERISDTWAQYLFGDEAKVSAPDDQGTDNDLYQALVAANNLGSELERAAGLCSSEGEIWARIYVDELAAPYPLLDWVSRANVYPVWSGTRLAAAAVVTELDKPPKAAAGSVWRHFEVHAPGVVLNTLFVGTNDKLGTERPLDEHPELADLLDTWEHGLPRMLLFRVPNKLRKDPRIGVSDYANTLDYFLDLNEVADIGAYNARLTLRRRVVISAAAAIATNGRDDELESGDDNLTGPLRLPRAKFDDREQVLVEDPLDTELGKSPASPFRVIEYSFDAEPLIAWKRDLVETALSRGGLTGQYVGTENAGATGYAISGTALRLRLIPTDKAGRSKARYWGSAMPLILSTMAQLDASDAAGRGMKRPWTDPTALPSFVRKPGLPVDEVEEAQRHGTLITNKLESIETGVKSLHPDWTQDEVDEEVKLIREDASATAGSMGGLGGF